MKIKKSIYNAIIRNSAETPYELGGIIGITDGVISCYAFDNQKSEYGIYRPNTEYLNYIIDEWQKNNISFGGIFHTHYPVGHGLSNNDLKYIKKIMYSLKNFYQILYFPIIIPKKEIILYRVQIINTSLEIKEEDLILIN